MNRALTCMAALAASLLLIMGTAVAHQGGMSNSITRVVKPYRITLTVGMAEGMHVKGTKGSGEMMLGGKNAACTMKGGMSSMAEMKGAQACNHHVEVHVQDTTTHKVLNHARVSITMVNASKHMTVHVPIATMMGSKGKADLHYGNNVYAPGGWYSITVKVNTVQTTFRMPILTHF